MTDQIKATFQAKAAQVSGDVLCNGHGDAATFVHDLTQALLASTCSFVHSERGGLRRFRYRRLPDSSGYSRGPARNGGWWR